MDEWTTGPALEIVLALRAIQVGDEVKVDIEAYRNENPDAVIPRDTFAVGRVVEVDPGDNWFPYLIDVERYTTLWGLSRHIVAWRRP